MRKTNSVLLSLAARTAATDASKAINTKAGKRAVAYLRTTAGSGTNETLDVKFQDSPDGVYWFDISGAAFTQATGVTTGRLVMAGPIGPFLRAYATIGGTDTPTFTYEVQVSFED